jgi:hypothetical protein
MRTSVDVVTGGGTQPGVLADAGDGVSVLLLGGDEYSAAEAQRWLLSVKLPPGTR